MQKNAEVLKTMNSALAEAYIAKTGKTKDEILKMMDKETWITASQALEMGFIDEVEELQTQMTNSINGIRLTEEVRQQVTKEKELQDKNEQLKNELLNDLDKYGV